MMQYAWHWQMQKLPIRSDCPRQIVPKSMCLQLFLHTILQLNRSNAIFVMSADNFSYQPCHASQYLQSQSKASGSRICIGALRRQSEDRPAALYYCHHLLLGPWILQLVGKAKGVDVDGVIHNNISIFASAASI